MSVSGHFVHQSQTVWAVLIEGMMRTISVNYFKFGPVIQEQMSFHYISNFSSDGHHFKIWHYEELFSGFF